MRALNPKRLSSFLRSRDAGLRTLMEHGEALARLTEEVRRHLPLPLSLHCRVGGLREGHLTLVADTPAWAAKLRFHAPALVQKLQRQAVTRIRVIITPPHGEPPAPQRRAALSATSARLLTDTAQGLEDPQLRAALLRLARRSGPSSEFSP